MTTAQLKAIGITTNSWLTLENKFCNIQLMNDGHSYPSPMNSQYYFDEKSELMFVRHTFDRVYKNKPSNPFVEVELNKYGLIYLRLIPGGITDSDEKIGLYHEVFDFKMITSFQ